MQGRERAAALFLYLILAALLFAWPIAPHFATTYIGFGVDQPFFIWCLVWWPYALVHHLNPFVSHLIFAPAGLNLTWTTPIPLLSMLAWPLTRVLGPVAAYNLLCIICPALSAWTAFLLCRHVTDAFWPALLGGYLFGFSAYVLGHVLGGHPDCFAIFLVPAILHLVLARLDARMPGRQFTVLLMALLVAQFLIADEMVATLTLAGAAALIASWIFGDHRIRRGIEGLAPFILLAYLGAAALMTPWLYYVFRDFLHKPLRSPQEYSIDVLNLVLPTHTAAASSIFAALGDPSAHFSGNVAEQSGYVGAPLLVLAAWFAIARRRTFAGRMLATMLLLTMVLAMGPRLHMAGHAGVTLPWRLVTHLPLLNQALPARVFLYSTLLLSIVAATWFSGAQARPRLRFAMATAVVLSLVPNFSRFWAPYARRNMVPEFFSSGQYRSYIARDEIVAVPPSGWGAGSEAMLWQATTGMYFRLASGYLPFAPASTFEWPIVTALMQRIELPDAADQWIAYAANHRASLAMTCERAHSPALKQMLEELGVTPIKVGGATLYRVPSEALAKYQHADAGRMEAVEQQLRFRDLLLTARTYLESGADPAKLKLTTVFNPGLHAIEWKPWGMQPQDSPVALRIVGASNVLIGVTGTYAAIHPLIERYGGFAQSLYFPFPHRWGEVAPPKNHCPRPLAMVFDLPELRRALQADIDRRGSRTSVP